MFKCEKCAKAFSRRDALTRHARQCGDSGSSVTNLVFCMLCLATFTRPDALRRHHRQKHLTERLPCKRACSPQPSTSAGPYRGQVQPPPPKKPRTITTRECRSCNQDVPTAGWAAHLRTNSHKEKTAVAMGGGVFLVNHGFNKRLSTFRISVPTLDISVDDFFVYLKTKVFNVLALKLNEFGQLKFSLELFGAFTKTMTDEESATKSFRTKTKPLSNQEEYDELWTTLTEDIKRKYQDFQAKGSGWTLKNWLWLEVNVAKYDPLHASSYLELPKDIRDKKAVLNIQNNDQECFKWSILAALHEVHWSLKPERVTHYQQYKDELNFAGMSFPITIASIPKFENLNNISVNVFGLERVFEENTCRNEIVGPLHLTASRKARHVNLLLISDDHGNTHYCLIRDMSRLVRSQISKREHAKFLCDGCLVFFTSEFKLNEHQKHDCNHVTVKLPGTDLRKDKYGEDVPKNVLKFEDFEKKMRVPFVVYADFESALIPKDSSIPADKDSFTIQTHHHVPYSFGYYIKCSYNDSLSKFVSYRGEDAAEVFVSRLEDDVKALYNNHLKHIVPMKPLSAEEEDDFQKATVCHICERSLTPEQARVRDHCHLTGCFRGAAHEVCNLNYKIPNFIPVIFHNLSGYDSHLFIKKLAEEEGSRVDVIPQNKERYISFTKHVLVGDYMGKDDKKHDVSLKLRFIDSFRFMAKSLDKLAQNLEDNQFREVQKYFQDNAEFQLIRQKGVFPYSYVTSIAKLDETNLPSCQGFYDELKGEECKQDDYDRALSVWAKFECKTLGDYSDIYLKSDVLILADVFENFRDLCMREYKLDPCQFYTAPGLSWSAALKCTEVKLELLTDIDMHHFVKKGIRGGVSQCSVRRAVANNRFMGDRYDRTKPSAYIAYLDATNLYGWAMSQALPTGGFKWLEDDQIKNFDVAEIGDDSDIGYILEVDLEYPHHLHDLHNELPFCPEAIVPPNAKSKVSKLAPNLRDKTKYIIHYRNLKQCLANGLKLKKIHRILAFNQSPWLKKYIDQNTLLRNAAKNEFEKDFFKLMNNAVFGKTMENVDKRVDIKLLTHWENIGRKVGAGALIAKPHFKSQSIFSENFSAIQMNKLRVVYDKPIYVGFSILDISKTCIYDFYYGFIKQTYGDKALLLYTDTDSLILYIETENFYDDMKENREVFDTSNYKPDNIHGIDPNVSVLGRMKDEYKGLVLFEFVGTGAKAYMVDADAFTTKKAKGIQQCVVERELTADDYRNVVESRGDTLLNSEGECVVNEGEVVRRTRGFRTHLHEVYTNLVQKVALSYLDDKRYLLPDSYRTLAWGHKDIPTS